MVYCVCTKFSKSRANGCQERRVLSVQGELGGFIEEGAAELNFERWTGWGHWDERALAAFGQGGGDGQIRDSGRVFSQYVKDESIKAEIGSRGYSQNSRSSFRGCGLSWGPAALEREHGFGTNLHSNLIP